MTTIEPADPEAAALELIVTAAEEATGSTAFREPLQDFCGLLHGQSVLAGLSWPDARRVAAAISYDVVTFDDGAEALRRRAETVVSGILAWDDRDAAAFSLNAAASVLDSF